MICILFLFKKMWFFWEIFPFSSFCVFLFVFHFIFQHKKEYFLEFENISLEFGCCCYCCQGILDLIQLKLNCFYLIREKHKEIIYKIDDFNDHFVCLCLLWLTLFCVMMCYL